MHAELLIGKQIATLFVQRSLDDVGQYIAIRIELSKHDSPTWQQPLKTNGIKLPGKTLIHQDKHQKPPLLGFIENLASI